MTDQTVNIPLLRKAVEWAEAEAAKPLRFSAWNQTDTVRSAEEIGRAPECGTCYCVAGFVAMVVSGCANPYERERDADDLGGVMAYAARELGLPTGASLSLFDPLNTIADVRRIAEDIAGERL